MKLNEDDVWIANKQALAVAKLLIGDELVKSVHVLGKRGHTAKEFDNLADTKKNVIDIGCEHVRITFKNGKKIIIWSSEWGSMKDGINT